MRHHFDFGADRPVVGDDLVRPESWDALRTQTAGAFALAGSRDELERTADGRPELGDRARAIDRWLRIEGSARSRRTASGARCSRPGYCASIRSGVCCSPTTRRKRSSDCARSFPEAEVQRHDLLGDPPLPAGAHLFHRVDTELTDAEWREALRRFERETVLVVATEIATPRRLLQELLLRLRSRRLSRAGWLRTRDSFDALWAVTHVATPFRLPDLEAWTLEPLSRPIDSVPAE